MYYNNLKHNLKEEKHDQKSESVMALLERYTLERKI